jgi:hypothetical protein
MPELAISELFTSIFGTFQVFSNFWGITELSGYFYHLRNFPVFRTVHECNNGIFVEFNRCSAAPTMGPMIEYGAACVSTAPR